MSSLPHPRHPLDAFDVVVLPGWRNSGPTHWQTRWLARFPDWHRVEMANWLYPQRHDWIRTLDAAVAGRTRPVLLVAHSLGCVTVAHWAREQPAGQVVGALLVAPADVERSNVAGPLRGFAPMSRQPLPFPALLLGSDNDPACSAWRAAELAQTWGADFRLLAGHGHINADSGLGDWNAGLQLLQEWVVARGLAAPAPLPFRWVA